MSFTAQTYESLTFIASIDVGNVTGSISSGFIADNSGGGWNRIPTSDSRIPYERFRKMNATVVNETTGEIVSEPRFKYRATSGLGHRLMRTANSYHIARINQRQHFYVDWGWECGNNSEGNPDIFDNLFGHGPMVTASEPNSVGAREHHLEFDVQPSPYKGMYELQPEDERLVNYSPSYVMHTICRRKERKNIYRRLYDLKLIYEKVVSDEQFFRQLRNLFRFNDRARAFTEEHSFSERLVVGVHIRAGNGEKGSFADAKRGFDDLDGWIGRLAISLNQLVEKMGAHRTLSKPPLLFVATDQTSVIDVLANATKPYGLSTATFDQFRPEQGVTFSKPGRGEACHEAWVVQWIDALLLSASDAVVAGRYSSFTQSLPLFTILADSITRNQPPGFDPHNKSTYWFAQNRTDDLYSHRLFCEPNVLANDIDCYDDYFGWLWQKENLRGLFDRKYQTEGVETYEMKYHQEVQYPCPRND